MDLDSSTTLAVAQVLGRGAALPRMRHFLAAGGQTPGGERRLTDLVGELDRTEPA